MVRPFALGSVFLLLASSTAVRAEPRFVPCSIFDAARSQVGRGQHAELAENHILEVDGEYEVLLPTATEGSYQIRRFRTHEAARIAASVIPHPLDLQRMLARHAAHVPNMVQALTGLKVQDPAILTTVVRLKDVESLKRKIFDRVQKSKTAEYSLKRLYDLAGGRVVVRSPLDVARVASRISRLPGYELEKPIPRDYERGYQAFHLILRDRSDGDLVEVQLMTWRMYQWVTWNANRVYKAHMSKDSPYFRRLQEYDQAIVRYVRALDEGVTHLPSPPMAEGIAPEDVFALESVTRLPPISNHSR